MSLKKKILLIILILAGSLIQGSTMFRSGWQYFFGLGFFGPNGFDGVWHLSLASQAFKGFPLPFPNYAGETIKNYHLFFDYLLAISSKLTQIPLRNLYFQILPLITSFALGILSFFLGYRWKKNYWIGFWFAFFNYFAGSFGYLVILLREGKIGGESLFWSMQSISSLINPPFSLSLLFLLFGMTLLTEKRLSLIKILFTGILFGLLINIKSYASVVALTGLMGLFIWGLIHKRREYLLIFISALCVTVITFLPFNRGTDSFFVFQPLWFVHSMIESTDRLFLPNLASMRYNFQAIGFGPRLVLIEFLGIMIFFIGNLGIRVLGFTIFLTKKRRIDNLDAFILPAMTVAMIIPVFFVQKGTAWNTIQFFYYFLFFANLYLAEFFSNLINGKNYFKYGALILLVCLTVPTTVSSLKDYWGWPPPADLPQKEIEALNFLKHQPEGVVLTYPYLDQGNQTGRKTPIPLRDYAGTSYVSAFSEKQTFYEKANLDILGVDSEGRKSLVMNFFISEEPDLARKFLRENSIMYIYLVQGQEFKLDFKAVEAEKIFDNSDVKILRVN